MKPAIVPVDAEVRRVVTLPNGRAVTLRAYVDAWWHLKSLPPDYEMHGWEWYPLPVSRILADMRRGMNDRITQGISYNLRGKK